MNKYLVEWWEERIYNCKKVVEAKNLEEASEMMFSSDDYEIELKDVIESGHIKTTLIEEN